MGTSPSEPTEPGAFEVAARRLTSGSLHPRDIANWSTEAISRLIDRVYFVIRNELMGRDQAELKRAIELLEEVIDGGGFASKSMESTRLVTLRALQARNARRYEVAKILAEDVLSRCPDGSWSELRYDAHITLADAAFQQGQQPAAEEHYAQALEVAENLGDEVAAGRALLNSAALLQYSGKPTESLDNCKRALTYFLANDCGGLAGWALLYESYALLLLGETERALESADRARNLFEVLETEHGLANALTRIGLYHHIALNLAEAKYAYDAAYELMTESGFGDVDNVEIYRAILRLDLGDLKGAHATLLELAERTSESGRLPHLLLTKAGLTMHAVAIKDLDQVEEYLDSVVGLTERTNFHEFLLAQQFDRAASELRSVAPELSERMRDVASTHRAALIGKEKG